MIAALLGMGIWALASSGPLPNRLLSSLFLVGGVWGVFALMLRPVLRIQDAEVHVVNPISTQRFPLQDIQGATGGRFLILRRASGEGTRVWAVQNANVSLSLGRPGRTERVAEQLNERLRRQTAE